MRRLLAAVPLLLAACAVAPVKPPDERVAQLEPFDRSALLLDDQLIRLSAYQDDKQHGLALVALREAKGKVAYTYVGSYDAYSGGALVGEPDARLELEKARAASAFHQPVQAKVGSGTVWCIHDRVPKAAGEAPGYRLTLEVYDADPRPPHPGSVLLPVAVFYLEYPAAQEGSQHGYLGVDDAPLTAETIRARGLPAAARGALVTRVSPGSPAARAGLQPGDVIVSVNSQEVASPDELTRSLSVLAPGAEVVVSLLRGKDRQELRAKLALRAGSDTLLRHNGTVVAAGEVWLKPDGSLDAVSFPTWRPNADFIIQGKSSRDMWGNEDAATEHIINDALVEWKNLEMPGWLRTVPADKLSHAILDAEKGVLALDVSIRLLKDKIDAVARDGKDPIPGAGEAEQLLEQRKMLLGVLLGSMKSAAAQRPAAAPPL